MDTLFSQRTYVLQSDLDAGLISQITSAGIQPSLHLVYPSDDIRTCLQSSPIEIDPQVGEVAFMGKSVALGKGLPFRLVEFLANNPCRSYTYAELMKSVWGDPMLNPDSVRTTIGRTNKLLRPLDAVSIRASKTATRLVICPRCPPNQTHFFA
jgi:DNA-binding response OmpR family regulator